MNRVAIDFETVPPFGNFLVDCKFFERGVVAIFEDKTICAQITMPNGVLTTVYAYASDCRISSA